MPSERVQPTPPAAPATAITWSGFPGEGGKKKVFLAHDARLDRDVAFSLIKTEA